MHTIHFQMLKSKHIHKKCTITIPRCNFSTTHGGEHKFSLSQISEGILKDFVHLMISHFFLVSDKYVLVFSKPQILHKFCESLTGLQQQPCLVTFYKHKISSGHPTTTLNNHVIKPMVQFTSVLFPYFYFSNQITKSIISKKG